MELNSKLADKSQKIFLLGNLLISLGILLVTVGGSWDITNHVLNKPESFVSVPHGVMYSGVAMSLIGTVLSFLIWHKIENKKYLKISLKIGVIGIIILISAGPIDFLWHSAFGLDGLLSPPHMSLIFGMILTSIGGMVGLVRYSILTKSLYLPFLIVIGLLPVWLASSGLISSLSLPFSNTDFFNFNPEPFTAIIVATVCYPFLISLFLISSSFLSKNKFGIVSLIGGLFLAIYGSTAILPNFAMSDTILFYSTNMIPLVVSDYVISKLNYKCAKYIGAGILGSIFYMFYYPYIVYTYNEVLLGKLVSPSLIYSIYFELIIEVFFITLIPAVIAAIAGCYFSKLVCKKIEQV
ncbi:hypothetical protein YTPLAS73_08860 [Nitrosarchaeum sp.]|nr:hypothetical protein YTPLAS73_08860 [Nitrosarchaeum sp.]